jgi:ribokinase
MEAEVGRSGSVVVVGAVHEDVFVVADRLPRSGETVTGTRVEIGVGGKGANLALAARGAGATTTLIACVGADPAGEIALRALDAAGVDIRCVARDGKELTGKALITVDRHGDNQITVGSGADRALSVDHVRESLLAISACSRGVVAVLVSLEISEEVVDATARIASERSWPLVLNPAPFRPLSEALRAGATVLMPNAGEAYDLLGEEFGSRWESDVIPDSVHDLLVSGPTALVVTLGALGALLYTADSVTRVPAPKVAAIDTSGAGDAFNGALAAALVRHASLSAAVTAGVHAGSAATTTRGANSAALNPQNEQPRKDVAR